MMSLEITKTGENLELISPDWDWEWDDLLNLIEGGVVIPILGPDLLLVKNNGSDITFDHYVAQQLANQLKLAENSLPTKYSLNDVVCAYLSLSLDRAHARQRLYSKIKSIVAQASFELPTPLMKLAKISHFDLFVTVTFDGMLEQALDKFRYNGKSFTKSIAYSPKTKGEGSAAVPDLLCARENRLAKATVYSLFGKVSTLPNYVICEEDMLEFVCSLQREATRPHNLFEALENNNLLFLGVDFSDWLARFFLRNTKSKRLSESRDQFEVIADNHINQDRGLVFFLKNFSTSTYLFHGDAVNFVDELWRRWSDRYAGLDKTVYVSQIPPPVQMMDDSVFLSYAREDQDSVWKLKAGLEEAGINVWFDLDRLQPGDEWELKIRRNIQNCALFVPIISQNTSLPKESYFRKEWSFAADRDPGYFGSGKTFIVPVIVDEFDRILELPKCFSKAQIFRLQGGMVTEDFVKQIVSALKSGR